MRVVLHVGLPKTGTTFLQGLLATHRDELRQAGVLYPFVRPGAMFHAAVELRGSHERFGLSRADVAGTWSALVDRARSWDGTVVLGHEVLAGATPAQVEATLAPLAGAEVDVVVTARDLGRQATAHWQEQVKLGDARSFAELEAAELRADTGRDVGPDAGGRRPHFWHAQDWVWALTRWSAASVPPERVHLVVCPAPGAEPRELWRRFTEAGGLGADALGEPALPVANPSLGASEIALLRAVNRELAGRLGPGDHNRLVKKGYAEGELAARASPPPRTPYRLRPLLDAVTDQWLAELAGSPHPVHGDLDDLRPVVGGPADPEPDVAVPDGEDPVRTAHRLRAEAARRPRRRGLLRRTVRS